MSHVARRTSYVGVVSGGIMPPRSPYPTDRSGVSTTEVRITMYLARTGQSVVNAVVNIDQRIDVREIT